MNEEHDAYGVPEISFKAGCVRISGRSILLEPGKLYNDLLVKFLKYTSEPLDKTEIHISLDSLNSASNRYLLNFLILAENLYNKGEQVDVFWYFKEEDKMSQDQGQIFRELLNLPFQIVEVRQ